MLVIIMIEYNIGVINMIGQYSLFELLERYGINHNNILLDKKDVLINKAEYNTIEYVLSFLRTELSISSKNIEKCPSILYCGVDNIRDNYMYLESMNFPVLRISNCLHVLGTDCSQLKETYEYVLDKYGEDAIYDLPSILRLSVERIKQVESVCEGKLSPYGILSAEGVSARWFDEGGPRAEEEQSAGCGMEKVHA